MWELVLSLYMLGEASDEIVFGQWRQRVLSRLKPESRMLLDLVPPQGYAPDFLSPPVGGEDPGDGIDAVLNTPRQRIGEELDRRFDAGPRPEWSGALARKEGRAVRALGRSMRAYFDIALRPYWGYISQVAEHSATSIGDAAEGPVAPILRLRDLPAARQACRTTVELEYAQERELDLRGRGLVLIPAFFCAVNPVTFYDPSLPPVLLYPVGHRPMSFLARAARSAGPSERVLQRLFGRTRAMVLRTLEGRVHTTGEIARILDISPASASEHASLLRDAGLVSSERRGNRVCHRLTPLGLEFLHGPVAGSTSEFRSPLCGPRA
ncbi:ArsR/SmtB family transcription factor [Microtetraspora malaysiensis]|uniref:ArsR/SmtB family transcription factor n=1 Tax=Microtetraspora malaysiensis TaxID=161358 RepID=UPI003D8FA82B